MRSALISHTCLALVIGWCGWHRTELSAQEQESDGNIYSAENELQSEPVLRGPVHEAFAEPVQFNPTAGMVVSVQPPETIEELPPPVKPEDENAIWISGYWAWNDDTDDYMWLSGVWRVPPPDRRWVPGYWTETQGGYQWISGMWISDGSEEIEYLPYPPESLENGPTSPQPSAQHYWVTGYWVHQEGRYIWQPGYWAVYSDDWVWVPPYYSWTQNGVVSCDGYYDYPMVNRGTMFAPVYFRGPIRRGLAFTPRVLLRSTNLLLHLFVRPNYGHYYWGDYYGNNYRENFGFYSQYDYHRNYGYDTVYAHNHARYQTRGIDYADRLRGWNDHFTQHEDMRPPRTIEQQLRMVDLVGSNDSLKYALISSRIDDVMSDRNLSGLFRTIKEDQRRNYARSAQQINVVVNERIKIENRSQTTINTNNINTNNIKGDNNLNENSNRGNRAAKGQGDHDDDKKDSRKGKDRVEALGKTDPTPDGSKDEKNDRKGKDASSKDQTNDRKSKASQTAKDITEPAGNDPIKRDGKAGSDKGGTPPNDKTDATPNPVAGGQGGKLKLPKLPEGTVAKNRPKPPIHKPSELPAQDAARANQNKTQSQISKDPIDIPDPTKIGTETKKSRAADKDERGGKDKKLPMQNEKKNDLKSKTDRGTGKVEQGNNPVPRTPETSKGSKGQDQRKGDTQPKRTTQPKIDQPKGPTQPKVEQPKGSTQPKVDQPKGPTQPKVEQPKGPIQPKVDQPKVPTQPKVEQPKGPVQPKIEPPKRDNPPKQEKPKVQEQPKGQNLPLTQALPKVQNQPRAQEQPKNQSPPRAQEQPKVQNQPRAPEQTRNQNKPRPQEQPTAQKQQRAAREGTSSNGAGRRPSSPTQSSASGGRNPASAAPLASQNPRRESSPPKESSASQSKPRGESKPPKNESKPPKNSNDKPRK